MTIQGEGMQDEEALRWQLRGLRRDIEPQQDLWNGIAAAIAATPQDVGHSHEPPARRFAPWAMAASVLLAAIAFWQILPAARPAGGEADPLIRQQAVSMTFEYEQALASLQQADTHPEMHAAFCDLDRSVEQILTAIDRDPNATFLLQQLRRTYARRLQLTQRAVIT
ncbi:MAG: hypothetical protein ABIP44_00425 [Pseudoxanthomonas sp.]